MSSGIRVFFIQNGDRLRRVVGEDHAAVGGQRLAVHQALRLLLGRARDLDREAVRLALRDCDGQRHLLEPRGGALERHGGAMPKAGRRRRRSSERQARRSSARVRAARPRSGPSCPARSALRAAGPAAGRRSRRCAPSPYGRRCPRRRPSDPVDEAIALDAIEPFDLHRLELARRVGQAPCGRPARPSGMRGLAGRGKAVD